MNEALGATFAKPFKEQVSAFRARLGDLVPTSAWDDIQRSAHDRAFMVAGATKANLLADLAKAVDRAIADGTTFETFQKDFRSIVERHGWHGWTGEGTPGGVLWRMRVIYRTNIRTSYMAGRYAQLINGNFPFWVYRHGGSADPRILHLSWDGLILPAGSGHPFWARHFPPNDWGCSCGVFGARSVAGAIRRGGKPDLQLPDNWDAVDPRTGTPAGIGKGWDYAPGQTVARTITQLRDRLEELPERPSVDLIQDWLNGRPFEEWFNAPDGNFPLVRIGADDAEAIGSQRLVADLSPSTAAKQKREHGDLTPKDYAAAQRTVSEASERIQDSPTSMVFVRAEPDGHVLVVKATKSGQGLFVTSFRRLSQNQAKQDAELRRLRRKAQPT